MYPGYDLKAEADDFETSIDDDMTKEDLLDLIDIHLSVIRDIADDLEEYASWNRNCID